MRVLYLVDTSNLGDTETQMVSAALSLHHAGHQVTVACLREEGPILETLQAVGVPIVELLKKRTPVSLDGLFQLGRLVCFFLWGNFHLLHAHDQWDIFGVPAARRTGTHIVIFSRRYLDDLESSTSWRNKIMRIIYRLSTHVVTNSESIRRLLLEREGLPGQKVQILCNAVDVDRFVRTRESMTRLLPFVGKNARLIVVVGNMYCAVKGHENLIAAASTVCHELPEATFLLIGDGRERPRLQKRVNAAGLRKNFFFLGSRDHIPELLACCDLSVVPSDAEGLPNAVLEALAAGLPVVATQASGVSGIIENGINGLLVPRRDPYALADAILLVLQNPKLAAKLGQAGKLRVHTGFSFERLVAELERLYPPPRVWHLQ